MGCVPLGATTLISKFTRRCPEITALTPPIPCAVWHVEQLKPSLMWRAWSVKLVLEMICDKLWHFPQRAYGPLTVRSGFGKRFKINWPGRVACENSYRRSRMCVNFEPCGPFGPVPPNSRLSSLLWQSVQRICMPMVRPGVTPSRFSMFGSKLGCGNGLMRACITGWPELDVSANCGMTFSGSPADTAHTGKYPRVAGIVVFPVLLPWHLRQLSYWFTAGFNTVIPSVALMPSTPFCDARSAGGRRNEATCAAEWGLWQSTHVAWRF